MTRAERQLKIEAYGRAHATLVEALREFPEEMWRFRPSPADWSIHEIVVHIADSEASSYIRCRKCIVEPGQTVMAYDEGQWARALDYAGQSADDALELFRVLRRNTWRLIQNLPEPTWSNVMDHPENGRMTLEDWLDVYTRHIPEHVDQMRRVHAAWLRQR